MARAATAAAAATSAAPSASVRPALVPVPLYRLAGLGLLFVHLLLSPLVFSAATVEVFEYNKVAILVGTAILLVGGWGARAAGRWIGEERAEPGGEGALEGARRLLREPIALGFVLLLVSSLCSTVVSINTWTSVYGAHESFSGIGTVAAYTVLFFATRALVGSLGEQRLLLLATAAAAAGASLYGWMQLTGLDQIKWGRTSAFGGLTRVFATMGHPNFLAAFLLMAFPVVAYFALRAARQRNWVLLGALGVTAILQSGMIVIANSRGAWAGFAAAAIVLALGWAVAAGERRLALQVVLGTAVALVLVGIGLSLFPDGRQQLESIRGRFRQVLSVEILTKETRGYIWASALQMFRDHPIFGVGLDGFQLAFEKYRSAAYWHVEWNGTPTKAHNEALHILAQQGIFGGIATLVLTFGVGRAFFVALRRGGHDKHLLVVLFAGAVGFYVQNIVSFTIAGIGTLFVTFAALLSRAAEWPAPVPEDPEPGPPGRRPASFETGAAILATQGVIWIVAIWGVHALVVTPYRANSLCREGAAYLAYDPKIAVEKLRLAVKTDPTKELYWVRLGTVTQSAAREKTDRAERRALLEESKRAYQRSIELVPENSYNHANLGRLLGELAREGGARPEDAYACFEEALRIDPNNAYFYSDYANAALAFGGRAKAQELASRCTSLYPQFAPPFAQLGLMALVDAQAAARERPAEARARFEQAAALLGAAVGKNWHGDESGCATAYSNLAAALVRLGRYPEAVQAGEQATLRSPSYADAHYNLASAADLAGDPARAHGEYVRVLQLSPGHEGAKRMLQDVRAGMTRAGKPLPPLPPEVEAQLPK